MTDARRNAGFPWSRQRSPVTPEHSKATTIMGLFWDNFLKSEPAFIMRDVIAIEIEKAKQSAPKSETEAKLAKLHAAVADLHRVWFSGGDLDKDAVSQACLTLFKVDHKLRD
jgi:hypothetical protein